MATSAPKIPTTYRVPFGGAWADDSRSDADTLHSSPPLRAVLRLGAGEARASLAARKGLANTGIQRVSRIVAGTRASRVAPLRNAAAVRRHRRDSGNVPAWRPEWPVEEVGTGTMGD